MDDPLEFVEVTTTLPKLPLTPLYSREPILTPRLVLRATTKDDFPAIHRMRSQPEVMKWTIAQRADANMAATEAKISGGLPPNDTVNLLWTVCLRETGEFIGHSGCFDMHGDLGWPVIGYMFVKESWGKGYASEFLEGFMKAWWALPRATCKIKVDRSSIFAPVDGDLTASDDGEEITARECFTAFTDVDNAASQRVLAKNGFQKIKVFTELDPPDTPGRKSVTLAGFAMVR